MIKKYCTMQKNLLFGSWQKIIPFKIVMATPCGIITWMIFPNSCLISFCTMADSANPPTRNKYFKSEMKFTI